MENRVNKVGKHACACCGYFTITEIAETCLVCFWEENFFQEANIDDNGGPNRVSLRVAKYNFKKIGVKDKEFKEYVRPPNENELP